MQETQTEESDQAFVNTELLNASSCRAGVLNQQLDLWVLLCCLHNRHILPHLNMSFKDGWLHSAPPRSKRQMKGFTARFSFFWLCFCHAHTHTSPDASGPVWASVSIPRTLWLLDLLVWAADTWVCYGYEIRTFKVMRSVAPKQIIIVGFPQINRAFEIIVIRAMGKRLLFLYTNCYWIAHFILSCQRKCDLTELRSDWTVQCYLL